MFNSNKVNFLIIEYPGYSVYLHDKDAEIIQEDALCVFDFLKDELNFDPSNIFVFGRSIGSGPATYVSAKRNPGAMILMSPFTSLQEAADGLVGFLKYFVKERFILKKVQEHWANKRNEVSYFVHSRLAR